jgi:hypothetical protein
MTRDAVVSRLPGLIEAEVDGELVGLHVDKGNCFGFNKTATRVWGLIEQPRTISQICEALVAEFDVEPDECEQQVRALLTDLEREELVRIVPASDDKAD